MAVARTFKVAGIARGKSHRAGLTNPAEVGCPLPIRASFSALRG